MACHWTRPDYPDYHLDSAIVSAGVTGLELAAQQHQATRRLKPYGFEHLDPQRHIGIEVV
ncbi:MAG: hypothetical protein KDI82_13875 [Gammaproteobacteria bacterium]|nr:hypothetical protein [Gammaproteobacteria bacterium]